MSGRINRLFDVGAFRQPEALVDLFVNFADGLSNSLKD